MRFLIFIFHYRFRRQALNNILKRIKIKKYYLINLSGPIFSIFGKILMFFKLGKYISCDGEPLIKKSGINLWMDGTYLKIPDKFKNLKNNCVIMDNIFLKEQNLIQFYPTLIKKFKFNDKFKFVYVGEIIIDDDTVIDNLWNKRKNELFQNYSLIDTKEFWNDFIHLDVNKLQTYYIKLKNRLKYHSIVKLSKQLNKKLIIVGDNWKKSVRYSIKSNFNSNYVKSLYEGNVCLDFGSKWGSLALYPRSIDIIENGGFLLQSLQRDSKKIFSDNFKDIIFNSFNDLTKKIEMFINNPNYLNICFNNLLNKFENDNLNNNTLDKIWEISKNYD